MELREFFREHPVCAVAFSGGVDSAYLLYTASAWGERTAAYFVKTPFQPDFELEDAREVVQQLGAVMTVIEFDVLTIPEVTANPPDRCYYCKRALFTRLREVSQRDGFPLILDGCNASDDASDRPGMRALRELGIRSPLRECGVTKAEVRRQAREAGLPVWNKPSYACLATRVPAGTAITARDLTRVADGERTLAELGLSDFRLRLRGEDGLLQVRAEQRELAGKILSKLPDALKADFRQIALDSQPRVSRET